MARLQRKYSKTGYYHIMLRGNERKKIFCDEEDRQKFIEIIQKKKIATDILLYAYCLMDNHVHMVLRDDKNEISTIMKGIATSYAMYFNNKYGRVGHMFQNRFKSEAIEDDAYLIEVIRYIHNNPVKACIVENPAHYKWSSYQHYISPDKTRTIVDADYILRMIAENQIEAVKELIRFTMERNDFQCLDQDEGIRTLEEGKAYLEQYMKKNWTAVDKVEIDKDKRIVNDLIVELRRNTSLSIVKIAVLLGVNRGMVERIRP